MARGLYKTTVAAVHSAARGDRSIETGVIVRPEHNLTAVAGFKRVGMNIGVCCDICALRIGERKIAVADRAAVQVSTDENRAAASSTGCIDICSVKEAGLLADNRNAAAVSCAASRLDAARHGSCTLLCVYYDSAAIDAVCRDATAGFQRYTVGSLEHDAAVSAAHH